MFFKYPKSRLEVLLIDEKEDFRFSEQTKNSISQGIFTAVEFTLPFEPNEEEFCNASNVY